MDAYDIVAHLTPQPQQLTVGEGHFDLRRGPPAVELPVGPENEACREELTRALRAAGAAVHDRDAQGLSFTIGEGGPLPDLPTRGHAEEGYVLSVTRDGIAAQAASAAGLLYAAQTLRQLLRIWSGPGQIPCLTIVDYPEFRLRGLYIEGGQERFGRIVQPDYLLEQIRWLAEFKMNALFVECYNLFPYASFPACADEGTLSEEDLRDIIAEAKRYHVTIVPSLQTLAQASELVWACEEGEPYREATAPGLMCPSSPAIYPFIKSLYRDLLTWFDDAPVIGVGCSEIDMQWQQRYCPECRERIEAGETVRDLLLGHAERCIEAVGELSAELGRTVRPLMWADEFYMYGPGKDWVGIDRIPQDTVMGYWKYWADYAGIGGLLERGYDVMTISAMYNHTFYLADLSPEDPPKSWPSMEQTGTRNITEMLQEAQRTREAGAGGDVLGVATASFSKHRLRAFDSIWYGFALNGHAAWSHAERPLDEYQDAFTRAFVRHYYDARTDEAADALARAYVRLDRCKSHLELANQTLHDVVGVYDTQEAGYQGNTLMGALRHCGELTGPEGAPEPPLAAIKDAAAGVVREAEQVKELLDAQRPHVGRTSELADLWLAAEKIAAHAERQLLMIDTQRALNLETPYRFFAGDADSNQIAPGGPRDRYGVPRLPAIVRERATAEARRWAAHRDRVKRIADRADHLYHKGDPLGLASVLGDIEAIERHLRDLCEPVAPEAERTVLLGERFEALDPAKWLIHGEPRIAEGHLETRAPGGWGSYCGIATRRVFELRDDRPLVVEFELTPLEMGADSQVLASATETGELAYRFSFYGPRDRFGVYTQSASALPGAWVDPAPGWRLRAQSPAVEMAKTYRVRAEITRRAWRVTVYERDQGPFQPPFWDTGPVPMDELEQTGLIFVDVEPEDSTGSSRWGPISIWREE